ncbi:MAG: hypothetical protein IOC94_15240, partial [Methylocystis sp.]|nr:hypothetical protein [Methylocystis sp.]
MIEAFRRLLAECCLPAAIRSDNGLLFATGKRHGEVLWEMWIEGFEKAVKLRPKAWQPLLTAGLDTVRAWTGLMHLADIARAGPRFSRQETDKISAEAHTRIGG